MLLIVSTVAIGHASRLPENIFEYQRHLLNCERRMIAISRKTRRNTAEEPKEKELSKVPSINFQFRES